jgi:hypothetical protein
MASEKLEVSLVENLKALSAKKNELIIKTGEIHLQIKELSNILTILENEYLTNIQELDKIINELNNKYPNGEIDLLEGTVTF